MTYKYHPIRFYVIVFVLTWSFWILAALTKDSNQSLALMFFGLCIPAITAILTVFTSKNTLLKKDFIRKITRLYQLKPFGIIVAIMTFAAVIVLSIVASVLFAGQSWNQFSFSDFSFSIRGSSALLTILLASIIEELGWRGYGEDAIASYYSWFKESIIFGMIWACWHLPLFFIPGTYHFSILEQGVNQGFGYLFGLNFLISVIPLGFLTTWVYVSNNRSMLACIILIIVAIIIVYANKELFFGKRHIGNILKG